jgi:phosphate uptake regulator
LTITDTDRGYQQIKDSIMRLKDASVRVGVFEGQYPGGQSVAEVALYLEFGTQSSREYAFMRQAFEQNRAKYDRMMADGYERITRNELTQMQLLHRIGDEAVKDIQNEIKSQGLMDTGRLHDAVRYEVVK